jgi:hypothetical protein
MSGIFVVVIMVAFNVSFGVAQTPKSQARMFAVKGSVVDRKGNLFGFALVCLKDTRSRMLRMKRAERNGHFTFAVLNAHSIMRFTRKWGDLASEMVLISNLKKLQK